MVIYSLIRLHHSLTTSPSLVHVERQTAFAAPPRTLFMNRSDTFRSCMHQLCEILTLCKYRNSCCLGGDVCSPLSPIRWRMENKEELYSASTCSRSEWQEMLLIDFKLKWPQKDLIKVNRLKICHIYSFPSTIKYSGMSAVLFCMSFLVGVCWKSYIQDPVLPFSKENKSNLFSTIEYSN